MAHKAEYYYSLRLTANTGCYRAGDEFRGASQPLLIGELPDCDIRYTAPQGRQPQYYAAVLQNEDGHSWRLVTMSAYVPVEVSGHGRVLTVCALRSGDVVSFGPGRASLKFRTHCDSAFRDNGRVVVSRTDNRMMYTFAAVIVALVIAGAWFATHTLSAISRADLSDYEASVYMIRLDSVDCIRMIGDRPDSVVWSEDYADGSHEMGTAFLTDEGLLLTARHCVQPWLGHDPEFGISISSLDPADIIRRVAQAETFNYTADSDTTYVIRSYCSVWNDVDSIGFAFSSIDPGVHIDMSRDMMVEYDDFSNRYFWRSITPHFSNRSMELGDMVVVETSRKGTIRLATEDEVKALSDGDATALLGYPETGFDTRSLDLAHGTINASLSQQSGMLVTKGEATHGFSGGPVFVKSGAGYAAAGVLSKVDPVNGEIKYSVPVYLKGGTK